MTEEIWRDIEGYEGHYQVSNFGRVKSFKQKTPRILKPTHDKDGYLYVGLWRENKCQNGRVHRLVAQAFIPNPEGKPVTNHKDGNPQNNHVDNLEWATISENTQHAYDMGLHGTGEDCYQARLSNEQVRYIRENPDNLTCRALAKMFGVNHVTISEAQLGKTYRHVGGKIRTEKLPNPRRVPDPVRAEIRRLYVKSSHEFGLTALAKKFNCTPQTVWRIINVNEK